MDPLVPLQIAFVAGGVIAVRTAVVLLSAVNGEVTLEERFAAEAASAERTRVAVVVEDHDVLSQGGLGVELHAAAFKDLATKCGIFGMNSLVDDHVTSREPKNQPSYPQSENEKDKPRILTI